MSKWTTLDIEPEETLTEPNSAVVEMKPWAYRVSSACAWLVKRHFLYHRLHQWVLGLLVRYGFESVP